MTRSQKFKLLNKIDKRKKNFNALKHYVFYCNKCNFKITVSDRPDPYIECKVGNYFEYEVDRNEYGKYISKDDRNINGTFWSKPANSICLDCGNSLVLTQVENNNTCEKCKSKNIVFWYDLPNKKCPACNGKFGPRIIFNTNDELREWDFEESIECLSKTKKKYGIIEENETKELAEEEKRIIEKEMVLIQYFMNQRYVLDKNYNIIKFDCHRSFHSPFSIIVEWFNECDDGKIIFCMYFCEKNEKTYIAQTIENSKIKELISILDSYNYFKKPNKLDRLGYDGATWTLEVQIDNLYKEISVWSPDEGVIYEIGKLLIKYSGAIINELY